MPSRKVPDGEFRDVAHPINLETREELEKQVLAKYEEELKKIREQGFATVSQRNRCFIACGCTIGKSGLPVAVGISVPASGFNEKKLRALLQQALARFDVTTQHTTQRKKEHV